MAFCMECGQSLLDGAKFCPECGAKANKSSTEKSDQRQTVYQGELHKCPSCGEVLNAFAAICPACGHELRGAKASSAVREFTQKLEQIETEEKIISFIRSFPVPNTKEDIFEFMILASTNIAGEAQKAVLDAWLTKFEQSYQKAKLTFEYDSDFSKIQEIYEKTHERINKALKKIHREKRSLTTKGVLLIVAKNMGVLCGMIAFIYAVGADKSGENTSVFHLGGMVVLIISACILKRRNAELIEYAIGVLSGILSLVLARFPENGSAMYLTGTIVIIIVVVNYFRSLGQKED